MQKFRSHLLPGVALVLLLVSGAGQVRAENNPRAKALAPQLRPLGLTPTADPQALNQLRPRPVAILSSMQPSYQGVGPDRRTLIRRAIELAPN
ncbi:MAG TPA: hypothetical protein PLB55_13035, partial [Prosthecobacter sp.]|nr:hypothetical protein [Prosthecobacter sp.]